MKRLLPLLLVMCCVLAGCQKTADPVSAATQAPSATTDPQVIEEASTVATVNGEILLYSDYYAIESAYLAQYEAAGVDLSDETMYAYLQDLALSYAVEQMLVEQDMQAQGCYDFDQEAETWFQETGNAAYETALNEIAASLMSSEDGMTADEASVYALAYAQSLGVTADTYVDYYRTQYAAQRYYEWLTKDHPVTEAEVQAAYEARVEESKTLYSQDATAFETALYNNLEAWYRPEGYRAVLQILLPAEGDTDEARLQSVQATVDAINVRLNDGEAFQALMAEYSIDANATDEDFLTTGYQVHLDSAIWEDTFIQAAFSAEMSAPGAVSQPFVSDLGVHILYYLADVPGGPIELTAELHDALQYTLYVERYTAAQAERINVLADTAEIIFH